MKISKTQLRKIIAEEISEMKLAVDTRGRNRYRKIPNITGAGPQYGGYEEEDPEESPCAMAAEEPPDLESRMDSIEGKLVKMSTHLDMIMSQLQISEEAKRTAKGNITQDTREKTATVGDDKFPIFDKKSAKAAIDLRGHAPEADRSKIINKAAKYAPEAAKKAREADKKK